MADLYGVTVEDIEKELGSLFQSGISADSTPDHATVRRWISENDLRVQLLVQRVKPPPAATDAAAPLAKSYIRLRTAARVVRAAMAGYNPAEVSRASAAYAEDAKEAWHELESLGAQLSGDLVAPSPSTAYAISDRETVVDDDDLNPNLRGRY